MANKPTDIRILVEQAEGVFVATARDDYGVIGTNRSLVSKADAVNPLRRRLLTTLQGPIRIREENLSDGTATS